MRPLRLVVRAFGPYRGEQVFDFRKLGDRTLFLIHGPTGSGKTTVLDAMAFALFGVCSGDERDPKRMRSDFADPAVVTEVLLDFRLGRKEYRVYRRPEQSQPKRRGEGSTTLRSEARLHDRTGLTDDTAEGTIVASQWKTVTEQVEEQLLHLRKDQFRQVVVLPQGQFRQLLVGDSKEREAILEVLFRTAFYRRIEETLKETAKGYADQIRQTRGHLKFLLEQAGTATVEELSHRKETGRSRLLEIRDALARVKSLEKEAQDRFNQGKLVQEKLDESARSERACRSLENQTDAFAGKRVALDKARKAESVAPVEKTLRQRETEARQADGKLQTARKTLTEVRTKRQKAEQTFNAEKERQSQRDQARAQVSRLEDLTQRVKELAEARVGLDAAQQTAAQATGALASAEKKVEECAHSMETNRELHSQAEQTAGRAELLRLKAQEAERGLQQRKRLAQFESGRAEAAGALEQMRARSTQEGERLHRAQEEVRRLEEAWIGGQAAILARTLAPGAPCPVCGSPDHPCPARSDRELPDERLMKKKRQELERLKEAGDALAKELAPLEKRCTELTASADIVRESLGEIAERDLADLQGDLRRIKRDLKAAEDAEKGALQLAQEAARLEEEGAEAARKRSLALQQRDEAAGALQRAHAEVTARAGGIPQDLQDMPALNAAKVRAARQVRQLEEAYEKANEQLSRANEEGAAAEAALETHQDAAMAAARNALLAREEFTESLRDGGFRDEHELKVSRRSRNEMAQIEDEIDRFNRSLAAARDRLQRAQLVAEGLEPPDLEALEAAANKTKRDLETALRESASLESDIKRVEGLLTEHAKHAGELNALEQKHAVLSSISEVAKGDGENAMHLPFHRFVLASLLDGVLISASQRLHIMSNGRFTLRRQTVQKDRRSSFGLDLEVEDAYTGTARPVSTLSGGESFLASLSLALGLADVVQAYEGGTHLDTIFVDEGFGSLDPDALEQALRALMDLQRNGRLVGIISHVPELRERISTRLEIASDRVGSTARFVLG